MDPTDLQPLVDQLDYDIDDLEDLLQPILASGLLKSSNNLPVMDKAKLHVLVTCALESLIFSYLRLHGVDAKQHQVFRELTRVKQYFTKIKSLETEPEERPMTLDKGAAGRFIKHGLSGNDKYDLERAEKQAKERARAQLRAAMLARKSAETPANAVASEAQSNNGSEGEDSENEAESAEEVKPKHTERKEAKQDSKGEHKSKDKKERKKLSKSKKERRQKKEETRKARKAQ